MENNNKSLIKINDSFFSKVIGFIRNLFKKNKNIEIKEEEANSNNRDIKDDNLIQELRKKQNYQAEKLRILRTYDDVKKHKIEIKDLGIKDLLILNELMDKEIELKVKRT